MESRTESASASDSSNSLALIEKKIPPVSYKKNTKVAYEILQFICSELSESKIMEAIKPFIEDIGITSEQLSEKIAFLTGDTCLHKAVEKDLVIVTQFLLEKGANPAVKNSDGKIPGELASSQSMKNIFHNFFAKDSKKKVSTNSLDKEKFLLHALVISNDPNKLIHISEYINKKLPLNEKNEAGKTPLHYVAESGDTKLLTLFCEQPELVSLLDDNGEDVFFICVRNKFTECLRLLLAMRPEFYVNYLRNKHNLSIKELVFSFLDHDIRKEMIHLLFPHFAAKLNNCADIIHYIGEGLPINIKNKSGKTILHIATENGNASLVLALIKQPLLDPNIQDTDGKTPLYNAVSLYLEEVKLGEDQLQVLSPQQVNETIKKIEDERLCCVKILTTSQHNIQKNIATNKGFTIDHLLENTKDAEKRQLAIKAVFSRYNIKPQSNSLHFFSKKTSNKVTPEDIINRYKYLPFKKISTNKIAIIPTFNTVEYNKKIGKLEEELEELLLDYGLKGRYFKASIKVGTLEEIKVIADGFSLEKYNNSTEKFLSKNSASDDKGKKKKKKKSFFELFVLVNEICLGTIVLDYFNLEYQDIYKKTAALLSLYEPHDIIRAIGLLTPFFCENQILAGSLIVKNILLVSVEFGLNLTDKIFMETLTHYLDKYCVPGVKQIMLGILQVVNEYYPYTSESGYKQLAKDMSKKTNFMSQVEAIIKNILKNKKYKNKDIDFIANEIHNLTLQFYKCCPLNVFFEHNQDAPFFKNFFSIFENLQDYISLIILSQKSIENASKIHKLFILVARKLVSYEDMNAITIVMAGLKRPAVSRVIKVDTETSNVYSNLKKLTSENAIFVELQEVTQAYPEFLRYISLICSDDVKSRNNFSLFFAKNSPDNFATILHLSEKLYFYLIELKKKLENIPCDFQSNILYQLSNFSLHLDNTNDKLNILEKFSYQLKPDAVNLNQNTIKSFLDSLIAFITARKPLCVMLNDKQYSDEKAIKVIREWMTSKTESEGRSESEILRLNETTKGILVECEEYLARLKTQRLGTPVERRLLERRNTFHSEQYKDIVEVESRPAKTL